MRFTFWKWEGAGNEFILCDGRSMATTPTAEETTLWCDRQAGIGADGLILFQPLTKLDDVGCAEGWSMDYLNADGSRSFCANGSRALFAFLRQRDWMGDQGWLRACDGDHAVRWDHALDLPSVQLMPVELPVQTASLCAEGIEAWRAETGSPHHLEWIAADTLDTLDVHACGSAIRCHATYAPAGINVNFIEQRLGDDSTHLRMRTYERGVEAETRGCGTGATAAALADHTRRGGALHRTIKMQGGDLVVRFDAPKDSVYRLVWLTGPAKQWFKGIWKGAGWVQWMLLLLLGVQNSAQGQSASLPWTNQAEVSVLTASPGADLYSAWGHTAMRVYDPGHVPPLDVVYNYGTFVFDEGFYGRFLKGRLNYRLSRSEYGSFQQDYLRTGRAILEQKLELEAADVQTVVAYLDWNYLPENRVYPYLFFSDNCSSRVLTVLEAAWGDRWDAGCLLDPAVGVTYRDAIRPYIQGDPWVESGIDFILGPRADRVMEPCGSSFLPDGLMAQLPLGTLDGQPITGAAKELIPRQRLWFRTVPLGIFWQPLIGAFLVGFWTLLWALRRLLQLRKGSIIPTWELRLGKCIQVPAAILGWLLLVMWGYTDHQDTWANWNLIWTSPLLSFLWFKRWLNAPWRQWIWVFLVASIPLFLMALYLVPQCVSLSSVVLAWAVWLSLDPWKVISRMKILMVPANRK